MEEGETIYEAAFKDKENADPGAKYPSFHQFDLPRIGGETQPNSPKKPQQKQKKQQKAQKLSPLHGIENRIRKVCLHVLYKILFQFSKRHTKTVVFNDLLHSENKRIHAAQRVQAQSAIMCVFSYPLSAHPVVNGCLGQGWGHSTTRKGTGYPTS